MTHDPTIPTCDPGPCDRAQLVIDRAKNCGWATFHKEGPFYENLKLALATEVEANGPNLNWSREDMYRRGAEAAARLVERWGEEAAGYNGLIAEPYHRLAECIRKINPHTGLSS